MSKMDAVVPTKLTLDSKLKFRCHKDIKCFTKCCSNIDIMLTPYDILRLRDRLEMTSEEFLTKYTYAKIDENSSHPLLFLQMNDEKEKRCPFVSDEGCKIYTDRPANCRYYPVGQGTFKKNEGEFEDFYFVIDEPHCYGFDEKKTWTIASWREDQEVDKYDEVNKDWKTLMLRKNLPGKELDEKKQMQFFMASYDLDKFRRFIFESDFLNVFDIDDETVEKLKTDDVELIKFGVKYITYIMMLKESLKLKKDASEYKKK